ncbi:hypothetical protein [Streptomyces sp. NPDC059564]|uniref:hypothetical protein n=1 Tax=Streptomyces sp. NPDC059564 TaxID=3346865 RepID=UPI003699AB23
MTFNRCGKGTRRLLAAGLCAASAVAVLAAGAGSAQAAGYRVYGGSYANSDQCVQAGSLSIGLGLYSRYECNPTWGDRFELYYVD